MTATQQSTIADAALQRALDRAVELARRGPARDPNPRVGCVLLAPDGSTLAEGAHRGAGTPHAETAALAAAGGSARGATAVVTLEPCTHHGRTPPCATALVEAGVAAVVYAVPDVTAAGGGAQVLAAGGVDVRREPHPGAEDVVADWARAARLGRPHVTWKIASTLDGRVAAADGSSRWITSPQAREAAHALRSRVGAVLVGTGTAHADDPGLTARDDNGMLAPDQPLRVVVGTRDLPVGSRLAAAVADAAAGRRPADHDADDPRPGEVVHLRTHDPVEVLADLRQRGVHSVLVEGGPTVGGAFWRAGLVDELLVHLAPALLGAGPHAIPDLGIGTIADAARLELVEVTTLGPDLQLRLRPTTPAQED
ncbi:bifunctional diaminohydroxyphosphoribosylaminopyrimidine deaminase/5-amino-6-(5-phosphoribosylamino)uracil reductase RibD [uncultured Serinicoccus sp.]|uniref:bifunctional diaminohydroxyphosphoribosylaminopyrimidine deaminase/5-amino-6-(5-phosphoribosylamino)uracil reductase RibD n=1 Tax=uncultured Serinicoccus sp. TaxID=735514 RepID=UPI00260FE8F6|nr:bifunctional diaminohydroxyphosphoribosylaminopyrimidine deaminase/5-amino-6-(5-phosphoribosylamino)uracil reductase RibD [uncultured Serinicoccus sp.]